MNWVWTRDPLAAVTLTASSKASNRRNIDMVVPVKCVWIGVSLPQLMAALAHAVEQALSGVQP